MSKTNFQNRTLFHGDNLDFLRAMNTESVDLIATDPPFKKGKDFHATPNSLASGAKFQDRWRWEEDIQPAWLDQIQDDHPHVWSAIDTANSIYMRRTKTNLSKPRDEVGSDMGAFLCFMAVRLLEMQRVLKTSGSIYLHCDPTASHFLKMIMDAIFGYHNFRNEIVWFYHDTPGRPTKDFARKHDIILRYVNNNKQFTFNADSVRIPILEASVERYLTPRNLGGRSYVGGESSTKGKIPEDVWTFPAVKGNSKEAYGYPTQKPLALYKRIILASSNEGDIVLDPFAGCATTLIAAEQLKRYWVGVDIWDEALKAVLQRLEQHGLMSSDLEEHLSGTLFSEDIVYTDQMPGRTDDKLTAAPHLRVKVRVPEPPGLKMSRKEMYEHLIEQNGIICQGCDREFDDRRYLQLDHNTPRSDGGINHISNRVLLCSPCNNFKSNIYTLSGLRRENRKRRFMRDQQNRKAGDWASNTCLTTAVSHWN